MNLCRFANFVDRAREMDPSWHTFLLVVLFLGFEADLIKVDQVALEMPTLPQKTSSGADGRTPVARGNDQLKQFRDSAKNHVHLVANLLLDPNNRVYCRILWALCQPIRNWYGKQSVVLRSSPAMAQWVQDQVFGGLNLPLRESWALMSDVSILQSLNFGLDADDFAKGLSLEHAALASQDRVAGMASEYTRNITGARAK